MPRLLAALYDRICRGAEDAGLREWRRELLSGLKGEVLEIGAGTGLNLPHYPDTVTRLVLCEPDRHMRAKLEGKLAGPAFRGSGSARPGGGDLAERPGPLRERVELVDASAEALPFADRSFDAVVETLVLCSVRDPARALGEIRRVLRDDGRFVFLEHVAAGDPKLERWQRRLEPIWVHLAGNCHLARHTADAIAAAGFEFERLTPMSIPKAAAVGRPGIRGVARKAAA